MFDTKDGSVSQEHGGIPSISAVAEGTK